MDLLSNVIVGTGSSSYFATVGLDLLFLAVRMADGDSGFKNGVLSDGSGGIRERLFVCKRFLLGFVMEYLCRCMARGEKDTKAEAVLSDLERILGVTILFSTHEYPLLQCGEDILFPFGESDGDVGVQIFNNENGDNIVVNDVYDRYGGLGDGENDGVLLKILDDIGVGVGRSLTSLFGLLIEFRIWRLRQSEAVSNLKTRQYALQDSGENLLNDAEIIKSFADGRDMVRWLTLRCHYLYTAVLQYAVALYESGILTKDAYSGIVRGTGGKSADCMYDFDMGTSG